MRQRRVRGIEEKLAQYSELILKPADRPEAALRFDGTLPAASQVALDEETTASSSYANLQAPIAAELLGSEKNFYNDRYVRWYQRLSEQYILPEGFERTYVEFGCGRGQFINALAENDPSGLYIGVEGCKTIVYRAIKKAKEASLENLYFIEEFINDASTAFEENSLHGMFLNFSDPWPKDRHADRRLTAPLKVNSYKQILKPGGFVALKTDNEPLYDYSFKVFEEAGFLIEKSTRSLEEISASSSEFSQQSLDVAARGLFTQTEYEQKFRASGLPIYYFLARKP